MVPTLPLRPASIALTIAAALFGAEVQAAPAGEWATYSNVRYAYRICYPAELLRPQGEADNSDGQLFKAADGAQLRVFGSNNVLASTLAQEAQSQARSALGSRGKLTYRIARPGWMVVSGDDGRGTIFYSKTFLRDDQFVTFQLTYAKPAAARYRPIAERLSRCFGLSKRPAEDR